MSSRALVGRDGREAGMTSDVSLKVNEPQPPCHPEAKRGISRSGSGEHEIPRRSQARFPRDDNPCSRSAFTGSDSLLTWEMCMRLEGKVALITGSAHGIG